jgi:hypothetical protein
MPTPKKEPRGFKGWPPPAKRKHQHTTERQEMKPNEPIDLDRIRTNIGDAKGFLKAMSTAITESPLYREAVRLHRYMQAHDPAIRAGMKDFVERFQRGWDIRR